MNRKGLGIIFWIAVIIIGLIALGAFASVIGGPLQNLLARGENISRGLGEDVGVVELRDFTINNLDLEPGVCFLRFTVVDTNSKLTQDFNPDVGYRVFEDGNRVDITRVEASSALYAVYLVDVSSSTNQAELDSYKIALEEIETKGLQTTTTTPIRVSVWGMRSVSEMDFVEMYNDTPNSLFTDATAIDNFIANMPSSPNSNLQLDALNAINFASVVYPTVGRPYKSIVLISDSTQALDAQKAADTNNILKSLGVKLYVVSSNCNTFNALEPAMCDTLENIDAIHNAMVFDSSFIRLGFATKVVEDTTRLHNLSVQVRKAFPGQETFTGEAQIQKGYRIACTS